MVSEESNARVLLIQQLYLRELGIQPGRSIEECDKIIEKKVCAFFNIK